jgi:L-rhamnose isomerase
VATETVYPKRKDGKPDRRYTPRTVEQKKNQPRYKNVHAPRGKAWCSHHQQYEPKQNFTKNKCNPNGLNSRCREGQREYDKAYRAKYGNRSGWSKTIRVPAAAHKVFKAMCEHIGTSMENNIGVAIRFWIEYGCKYPGCRKPKGARYERCDEHALAVSPAARREP